MKFIKLLYLFSLALLLWSCSEDDNDVLAPPTASFNVTVDPDNANKFYFDNTTPNAKDYYSYWEFKDGGQRVVDAVGLEQNLYSTGGDYNVTLTVVGQGLVSKATDMIRIEIVEEPETPGPGPEDTNNLILNGNLEMGDGDEFTNWGKFNGADRMVQETAEVYDGARGMKVTNPADGEAWETQFASDAVATNVGEQYTISVWIKGDVGTIRFSTNANLGDEQYAGDYTVTSDWAQYVWTITASTAETVVILDMGASAATYFVDAIAMASGDVPLQPTTPGGPESLALNGGLEEGDGNEFTNWGKFNGADRMVQENAEVYEGERAMKVTNPADGNSWETQLVGDAFATQSGENYTASVWVKGDAGIIRFSTNPGSDPDTAQYAGDYTVTSDWAQYTWKFTANTDETNLVLDMGATGGTYYIDAIAVVSGDMATPEPTPEAPESLALNGGLEEGDGNEFTNWGKFNGDDRMAQETGDVYEGERAMKITNPADGNPWETQFVSDAFATESGTDYIASVWVKGDTGIIRFSTNPGSDPDTAQYAGDYTITAEWEQYSWNFTANSTESNIVLDMGTSTATFIIDKIEVLPSE